MFKKCLSVVLAMVVVFSTFSFAEAKTASYPSVQSVLSKSEEKIFKGLYESFEAKCEGASDWYALYGADMGTDKIADTDAAIATARSSYGKPGATNLSVSIIVLSALGVDATAVDDGEGGTIDLVDKLATTKAAIGSWCESPAYALIAYAVADAEVEGTALNAPDALINTIKTKYLCKDGGFGWGGSGSPDTIGATLAALAPYTDNADAKTMIKNAVTALKSYQNTDGGFGYSAGSATNIDSTAMAIVGLCAVGIDPDGAEFSIEGKTAMDALLSYANDTATGLSLEKGLNVSIAENDCFRALAAYSGFRNTGSAYNVFTMTKDAPAKYKAPKFEISKNDGIWSYNSDGVVLTTFTGFVSNANGSWYVKNGLLNFKLNSFVTDPITKQRYKVTNGKVDVKYGGLVKEDGSWKYYWAGKWQKTTKGFLSNQNGRFRIDKGVINWKFNGKEGSRQYVNGRLQVKSK